MFRFILHALAWRIKYTRMSEAFLPQLVQSGGASLVVADRKTFSVSFTSGGWNSRGTIPYLTTTIDLNEPVIYVLTNLHATLRVSSATNRYGNEITLEKCTFAFFAHYISGTDSSTDWAGPSQSSETFTNIAQGAILQWDLKPVVYAAIPEHNVCYTRYKQTITSSSPDDNSRAIVRFGSTLTGEVVKYSICV